MPTRIYLDGGAKQYELDEEGHQPCGEVCSRG